MIAIRVLLGIVVFACAVGVIVPAAIAQSDDVYEIFELVNRERSRFRLSTLEWDDELASVARKFSRQMSREGFFSHNDRNGNTVMERAADARWTKIGENLFTCTGMDDFTEFSVRGWMKSASHRRNMLDREWTDTGIGIYRGRGDRIYVTQVFVRR